MTSTTIDCRWLGYSGVGRVTEQLLEGLIELAPTGEWTLWGPPAARSYADRGGWRHVVEEAAPVRWLGQAGWRRLPRADRYLFLHAVRPLLSPRPSVVLLHDTIPTRFADPRWKRPLQRAFYAASVRLTSRVAVYSDATAAAARQDLWIKNACLSRIRLTTDLRLSDAVLARRQGAARPAPIHLLYVGLDRPQKNLRRAIDGFAASEYGRGGGRFVIVGLQQQALAPLREVVDRRGLPGVTLLGRCSDEELVGLYSTALGVIAPSLEEGYGLPVVEALAAGIPVCCSADGALAEAAQGMAALFDPRDVADMSSAIDRTVRDKADEADRAHAFRRAASIPSAPEFARQFLDLLDEAAVRVPRAARVGRSRVC